MTSDMSNSIRKFISDRKDNKIKILLNDKFLEANDKGINQYLINKIDKNDKVLKEINNLKQNKEQTSFAFQQNKYNSLVKLINDLDIDASDIIQQCQEKVQQLNIDYEVEKWLNDNCSNVSNDNCSNASKVSMATHVAKLTHSSNKGTCFYDDVKDLNDGYLTTSQIKKIIVDAAYESASYSPIASLLLVEDSDKKPLYQMIINDDYNALEELSKNKEQADEWAKGLKQAFSKDEKCSHSLSKQLYFPVDSENYHLLSLLKSSSLMQEIFKKISKKTNDKIYKQRTEEKYSSEELISYPGKAILSITKSSHQNSSKLNGKRSGKLFLFSTQPPTWQNQLKPPISKKSVFDNYRYQSTTKENITHLVKFLLRFENIDLSIKDPEKRQWIEKWVDYIVDDFLYFVSIIHTLPPNWSAEKNVKLKIEHQYLLDPYRKDIEFQANKKELDWQMVLIDDFSTWLNRQLKNKDKTFTPQKEYSNIWKKIMKRELREHSQIIMEGSKVVQ